VLALQQRVECVLVCLLKARCLQLRSFAVAVAFVVAQLCLQSCGVCAFHPCRFSGMLEDMSALPALDWLDLSDNELTGPLPAFPLAVRCAACC
jgi:hypothetical protein